MASWLTNIVNTWERDSEPDGRRLPHGGGSGAIWEMANAARDPIAMAAEVVEAPAEDPKGLPQNNIDH